MDFIRLDALVAWIGQHPLAAGLVIFLIAFGDALVIVGVAIPAVPLLFAVGTMVGLGHVDGGYALVCASLGAFIGDGISFWVGHRYGPQLRQVWPFRSHPEWLAAGERSFRRHGMKSLVIARYVGAIRPFVPAIVGMLGMRLRRYVPASLVAALLWSATFLAPGWVFGTSLDLVAAVAGRLSVVIAVVVGLIALIWASVFYVWRWTAPRAADLLERALAWSHRHPVLGRYSEALIDPNRKESASLLLLALGLLGAGWGFFSLLIAVGGGTAPSGLDLLVHQGLFGLRHPLADPVMAFLASLGDAEVLAPAVLAVFAWLWWRRRHAAAWHWLAAPAFALVLAWSLGYLLEMPRPPAALAAPGFGFPSATVTLATVVYGFFAVLIARELPGRRRVWPYVLAGLLVSLLGFARLYLGAHWLSDVLAGIFLGLLWTALLGLGYRRRLVRAFWVRPTAAIFFAVVIAAAAWHGSRSKDDLLAEFDPPLLRAPLAGDDWWQGRGDSELPARRNELRGRDAWPLNVQYAGSLRGLQARLRLAGWKNVQPGGWSGLLQTLDRRASPQTLAILPATHQGRREALLMVRRNGDPAYKQVLRLWPAPYQLSPGGEPLWIGAVQELQFTEQFDFFRYWAVQPEPDTALAQLRGDLRGLMQTMDAEAAGGAELLRLRAAPRAP